jgi:predicted nucleotidyltransferase
MDPIPQIDARTAVLDRHPEIDLGVAFGSLDRGRHRPDCDLDLAVVRPAVFGARFCWR